MRNIINPQILGFQRRFPGCHERFQDFKGDFPDFAKDLGISRKISLFQGRFPDFGKDYDREVYEISVSGGPLDYVVTLTAHAHIQRKKCHVPKCPSDKNRIP